MKHKKLPRLEFGKNVVEYVMPGIFRCQIPPQGSGNHDHFKATRGAPPWGSTEWIPVVRRLAKDLLPLRPDCIIYLPLGFVTGGPTSEDSIQSLLARARYTGYFADGDPTNLSESPGIYLRSDIHRSSNESSMPDGYREEAHSYYGLAQYWQRTNSDSVIECLRATKADWCDNNDLDREGWPYDLALDFSWPST